MNDLIYTPLGGDTPARMTSKEIADLCGKRHDNARRTIETLAESDVIVHPQIEDEPETDALGRVRVTKVYVFTGERGKRDSIVVMAQLSPEFTARLVDRWQELEARHKLDPQRALSDPATLRGLLLQNLDKVIALEGRVKQMEPEVAAFERIAASEGSLCITDTAKTLQIKPKVLFQHLRAKGWIYSRGGGSSEVAYQDKLQAGLLEHKVTTVSRSDGTEKSVTQVRVTPKGLARLAKDFPPSEPMAMAA